MAACRFTCDHVAITRHRVEQRVPKPRYLGTQESFKCQPFLSVKLGRNIAVRARNSGDAGSKSDAPDWDAEMSIFKKRTMKPGQLAALRQTEGEASLGKVMYHRLPNSTPRVAWVNRLFMHLLKRKLTPLGFLCEGGFQC